MSVAVQQLIDLKTSLVAISGFDDETLRVLASVPAHLACALLMRRPVASAWPWLLLLILAAGNEAATALANRALDGAELPAAARDVALLMALPTVLLAAARMRQLFPRPEPPRTIVQFALPQPPVAERIVDAEFEEIH